MTDDRKERTFIARVDIQLIRVPTDCIGSARLPAPIRRTLYHDPSGVRLRTIMAAKPSWITSAMLQVMREFDGNMSVNETSSVPESMRPKHVTRTFTLCEINATNPGALITIVLN